MNVCGESERVCHVESGSGGSTGALLNRKGSS